MPSYKVKITRIVTDVFEYKCTAPDHEAAELTAQTNVMELGVPVPMNAMHTTLTTRTTKNTIKIRQSKRGKK